MSGEKLGLKSDVLTIALAATICGAESCVDFAYFARDREALFCDFLELPSGLPSHDTFSRLSRLLDPAAFALAWGGSSMRWARPDPASSLSTARPCGGPSTARPDDRRCTCSRP